MATDYVFRQWRIRAEMVQGLKAYVNDGLPQGSFVTAVLANDLYEAAGRADNDNLANLQAYIGWLYNEAPRLCHGSYEAVEKWIEHGGLNGLAEKN